jgi:hypothetical protein
MRAYLWVQRELCLLTRAGRQWSVRDSLRPPPRVTTGEPFKYTVVPRYAFLTITLCVAVSIKHSSVFISQSGRPRKRINRVAFCYSTWGVVRFSCSESSFRTGSVPELGSWGVIARPWRPVRGPSPVLIALICGPFACLWNHRLLSLDVPE